MNNHFLFRTRSKHHLILTLFRSWFTLYHDILGLGTPCTEHSNLALSPTLQVLLIGFDFQVGGTEILKMQGHSLYETYPIQIFQFAINRELTLKFHQLIIFQLTVDYQRSCIVDTPSRVRHNAGIVAWNRWWICSEVRIKFLQTCVFHGQARDGNSAWETVKTWDEGVWSILDVRQSWMSPMECERKISFRS